ncbi:MAG: hypothetical protein K2X82_13080 [Gemmataceae bacterium]|nr:hypothetical protein [Gemmataceae bacterium]
MSHILFGVLLASLAEPGKGEAHTILEQARLSRLGIKSYHVVVVSQIRIQSQATSSQITERVRYEAWSDGRHQRCDRTKLESNSDTKAIGTRYVWCRNCPRDGYVATTMIGSGFISPLAFRKDGSKGGRDSSRIEWEQLGLLDGDLGYYAETRPDTTLSAYQSNGNLVFDRVTIEGNVVCRLTASGGENAQIEAWLRPDLGMNPVRFRSEVPGVKFVQESTIRYVKAVGIDIWFPASIRHIRTMNGQTLVDETVTVETAEINRPIPADVFALETFGMPKGTPIEYPEIAKRENQPTWDGENVDPNRTRGQQATEAHYAMLDSEPPAPDTPEPGRRWPYYLGAGLLAVVGGGLLTRALRRRAAAG